MKDASTVTGVGTPTAARPYGPFADDATPGDGTGTAVRKDWQSDLYYSLIAVMASVGITPDDVEEDIVNSQLSDAIQLIKNSYDKKYINLVIKNNASNPAFQVDVAADELQIGYIRETSFSATVDITSSGFNGLDTGSEASSTWYYLWAIAGSGQTSGVLLSTSLTSPTLPANYTEKYLISAIYNTSGGDFRDFSQRDTRYGFASITVYSGAPGSSWNSVDMTDYYPAPITTHLQGTIQQDDAEVAVSSKVAPNSDGYNGAFFSGGDDRAQGYYKISVESSDIYVAFTSTKVMTIRVIGIELDI